jgi:hypothetical protein
MTADLLSEARFPVVELGRARLNVVQVERMPPLDRKNRYFAGHIRTDTQDILLDARAIDPMARRLDGIGIRFLPADFTGASYGLALALADKRLRFAGRPDGTLVIATGEIVPGGRGRIGRIEGFEAKAIAVAAAVQTLEAPAVFAFPAENGAEASAEARSALARAKASGRLTPRPAKALGDLADLWTAQRPRAGRTRIIAGAAVASLAAVAVGGFAAYRLPAQRCEAALRQLDARRDPDIAQAAVDRCREATDARPQDGRLHFLSGQAYAAARVNLLAEQEWRRAAELGDPNGMATWGRQLWVSAPRDPGAVNRALGFLKRAAMAGSFTAAEDIGYIYMDGQALPVDTRLASRWFQKAAALRARRGTGA